jgi:hypothetical protein
MYLYLRDVYEVFLDLHSKGAPERTARRIAKLLKLKISRKSHLIRVLIEATAGVEDNRAKIKWTGALRYAHGWLQRPERLERFLDVNKGIAGCTAKFAFLQKKRRERKLKEQANSSDQSLAQSTPKPQVSSRVQILGAESETPGR